MTQWPKGPGSKTPFSSMSCMTRDNCSSNSGILDESFQEEISVTKLGRQAYLSYLVSSFLSAGFVKPIII